MDNIMTDIFDFLYQVGLKLVELGNTLYTFLTRPVSLPGWLADFLNFVFGADFGTISMWALLGGSGVVLLILWSIFGW